MNFGKLLIQGIAVFVVLIFFSLAGAITPQFTSLGSLLATPTNIILYLVTAIVLTAMGYFLGVGVKGVKKPLEAVILAYGSAFVVGGVLALMTLLKFPYSAQLQLNRLGTAWYDPWLLIFFVGAPIILTFVVG